MADSALLPRRQRPSSVKLAGVKHGLYHPRLPSLRRMDMDTTTHKLPTEHSRTSTLCSTTDFTGIKSTQISRKEPLHCKNTLHTSTQTVVQSYQTLGTPSYTENWRNILASLAPNYTQTTEAKVHGLAVRSKPPAIAHSWQYSRPYSAVCPTTPRPMAATLYSRYRVTRPFSASPWK